MPSTKVGQVSILTMQAVVGRGDNERAWESGYQRDRPWNGIALMNLLIYSQNVHPSGRTSGRFCFSKAL